ncbi:DNA-directed RNA polymerase, subunit B' [Thermoplasmatales archaeon BRNA1]|nr:DNA-directed RNA polymerase, subunit B' [Thermoplasmatales archaeon BRNA1]
MKVRDLVNLYFKDKNIVNHHIASFDDFLCTKDNPNSRMQKIVDDIRVPTDDAARGIIRLDTERTGGREIEIRIGRRRREDGTVDPQDKPTIRIDHPQLIEANGYAHDIHPMEARLRNLNYMSPVSVHFEVTIDGEEMELENGGWVRVGEMPMMIKSKGCNLYRGNLEEQLERKLNDEEYAEELVKQKEDPREPGGYFIIGGTERVLITLEDLAPNRVMCEYDERYGTAVETAKVFSQREGYRALTQVEKKKDGILMVSVPVVTSEIPLIALMKALGMESDSEIYDTIVSKEYESDMANIVYANIEDSMDPKKYAPNAFHTTEDAIAYLERNFAAGQAKEYRTKKVESILDRSLLPHLGDTKEDRKKKAIYLGRIAKSVLEMSIGKRKADDKDHYSNKRLKLSGDLMEDLFRNSFSALMKDLKYQLERNMGRKRNEINIASSIRPDLFTHKIIHALATGNWVGGRAGVSQLLDRTSNMSTVSHLRRITSSLTRSQPHFEARDLHPTQWGRLCPSETPEGQNCGLVKNAALIIDVSKGVPDDEVITTLRNFGLNPVSENGTRVFVNGDLVGTCSDSKKLIEDVKEHRRYGNINNNVNIRYDEEMGEIIINCDDGRLRRPLLILKDGHTVLNREHIDGMREGKISWDNLFHYGVMEWVDAEEEEDALVLVTPYETPKRCPCCGHALSETDVDWMNPGKKGDCELSCRWCGDKFTVPSKLENSKVPYTHLEVDPMIIIGVAAGIVPYPEHNSAPRVTMGAGMAKQALGIAAANYRIRPDTRGHVMHYPQVPMVQTQTMDYIGYKYRPAGQNFCIAVMSYHGYNIEDAIVMNKSSVDRGLGRTTFLRSYRAEERRYPGGQEDRFEIPSEEIVGIRADEAYAALEDDGIISPETFVKGSDVLIGKTSPPRFIEDPAGELMTNEKRRETSVTVRPGEQGYVDSVIVTESDNGSRLVRVKVRDERIPELGDKFCSRFGQKGVVGRLVDQCDMPFTADGVTPDIVVNPHGIPSRMTIGHVLEMIAGKVGSMEARTIDGTAFSGESEDSIRDGLVRNGFARTGKEIMYNGRTGHMVQTDVYTGVIFYEKLHHMVSGKLHVRSRGPVQILTRQPTEGRSRQGGLRFGEMERDCLIGHGVAMVIKDRLLDESDGTQQYVCGNPKCGHIAIMTRNGQLYCPVCGNNSSIHLVQTSYAFKLLMDELLSLGVAMRLQLEDLS